MLVEKILHAESGEELPWCGKAYAGNLSRVVNIEQKAFAYHPQKKVLKHEEGGSLQAVSCFDTS